MITNLPHGLLFWVGLVSICLFFVKQVVRFAKRPHDLLKRYGGGWAVITGGSDGIGLGFGEELAKLGFNIVVISRNKQKIEQAWAQIVKVNSQVQVRSISADFSKSFEPGFYEGIFKQIEDIDVSILVNNVGALSDVGLFSETKTQDIFKETTINTMPAAMMTRLMLPKLLARPKRSGIITLSSYSMLMRLEGSANYCSTKLFDDVLSRSLEYEYGHKVDFLSLRPGIVTTEMSRNTTTVLTVNRKQCTKGALNNLGRLSYSAGSLWHELQSIGTVLVSESVRDYFIGKSWKKIGETYKIIDMNKRNAK